ncbi:MAG: class I SAM-dependent methyltransferase [Saprospiraceae bacterium]|nr:class I SAM-dependent methyltransferase [Saprospiraceae bacterium]
MRPEFDAVAASYDKIFGRIGVAQRDQVRQFLALSVAPARVLELNCGAGDDAVWLASKGYHVLATDVSPEMIEIAAKKAHFEGFSDLVTCRVCAFENLTELPENGFDLVFSNFGGLNCIGPEALQKLNNELLQKLQPLGSLIVVVMGRFCWWETLYFVAKGKFATAFRRLSKNAVPARLGDDVFVSTWYYAPAEFQRYFPGFKLKTLRPVGFWLPPSYLNHFFARHLRLFKILVWMEKHLMPPFAAYASDHYVLELERIPSSDTRSFNQK